LHSQLESNKNCTQAFYVHSLCYLLHNQLYCVHVELYSKSPVYNRKVTFNQHSSQPQLQPQYALPCLLTE